MSSGRALLLGCGTSTGVPLIGCRCPVCTSNDERNRRLRASLWFTIDGVRVLVDTSTDLRQQALDNGIDGVDHVIFTHAHADHVHGIDDMRMFNFLQMRSIPCWADAPTRMQLIERFAYIFAPKIEAPSAVPRLELRDWQGPIPIGKGYAQPIPIMHGREEILGLRVGNLAYLTDISELPESSLKLLAGVRTVILGALRYEPHPTHMTVAEAVATAQRIGAQRTILTHMSHNLEYQALARSLPPGIEPGYDGMVIGFEWT